MLDSVEQAAPTLAPRAAPAYACPAQTAGSVLLPASHQGEDSPPVLGGRPFLLGGTGLPSCIHACPSTCQWVKASTCLPSRPLACLQSNQFGVTHYAADPSASLFEDVTVRVNFDLMGGHRNPAAPSAGVMFNGGAPTLVNTQFILQASVCIGWCTAAAAAARLPTSKGGLCGQ